MRGLLELTMEELIATQRLIGQTLNRSNRYMVCLHAEMPLVRKDFTQESVDALKTLWRLFDDNNQLLNEAQLKDDRYFTEKYFARCKKYYINVVGVLREFVKSHGDEQYEPEPETQDRKMRNILISHQRERLLLLKTRIAAINIDRIHTLSEMEACQATLLDLWKTIEKNHYVIWSHYRISWPDVIYELAFVLHKNMYETTISLFNYKIDSYMYPSVRVIPHIGIPTWRMFDRTTEPHAFTVKSVAWANFSGLSEVIRTNTISEGERRQLLIRTFLTYQVYEPLTPESSDNEGDADAIVQQFEPSDPEDAVVGSDESVLDSAEEDDEEPGEAAADQVVIKPVQPPVPEEQPEQAVAPAPIDDSEQMPPPAQVPRAAPRKRTGPVQIAVVSQESAPAKRSASGSQAAPIPGVSGVQRIQLLVSNPNSSLVNPPKPESTQTKVVAQMKRLAELNMSESKVMSIPLVMTAPAGVPVPTAAPKVLPPTVGAASMKMAIPMKMVASTNTNVPMFMAVPMTMRMPMKMLVTADVASAMESAALLTLVQPRQRVPANEVIQHDLPMELVLQAPTEESAPPNQPTGQNQDQAAANDKSGPPKRNVFVYPSGSTKSFGLVPMELTLPQSHLSPMINPNIAMSVTENKDPAAPNDPNAEQEYDVD
uniref:SFRICE_007080 n=1 Tax=Spodoptera frugiperda TaxID=7108 RepID=A0A2H1VN52_SPOFR